MIDFEGTEKIELLTPQSINKLEATTDITTTSIPIKWKSSPSPDIKDYNIYLNDVLTTNVVGTTYTFNGLSASTKYKVAVRARNLNNYESIATTINTQTLSNSVLSMSGVVQII